MTTTFASGEVDVHELPELVRAAAAPWREVLARPDVAVRPDPVVWSPLEYACHVRDVLRLFAERATLIRSEDAREGPLAFAEKRQPVWKAR